MQQDVGHAEVSETPCESRDDLERGINAGFGGENVSAGREIEVAGNGSGIGEHGVPAAGDIDAEYKHYDKCDGHDKALNEARHGGSHESAGCAVGNYDGSGDYHCGHVIKTEEAVEKLAAGGKARGGVGDEKDDDGQRADGLYELGPVAEAAGKKVRDGDGVYFHGVAVQSLGDNEPVEICTGSKADSGPAGLGNAAEERQSGNTHEQICAHI